MQYVITVYQNVDTTRMMYQNEQQKRNWEVYHAICEHSVSLCCEHDVSKWIFKNGTKKGTMLCEHSVSECVIEKWTQKVMYKTE
jgi:hypothetical protein